MNKDLLDKPLDDAEMRHYLDCKNCIMTYAELNGIKHLNELLPTDKSYKVILIETSPNNGHWVGIGRDGDTVYYFNSYGEKADADWRFIPKQVQRILDEDAGKLTELLKNSGYKIEQNTFQYQKFSPKITTCGRWVVLFLSLMKNKDFDLDDFEDFVKDYKKDNRIKNTDLVSTALVH